MLYARTLLHHLVQGPISRQVVSTAQHRRAAKARERGMVVTSVVEHEDTARAAPGAGAAPTSAVPRATPSAGSDIGLHHDANKISVNVRWGEVGVDGLGAAS